MISCQPSQRICREMINVHEAQNIRNSTSNVHHFGRKTSVKEVSPYTTQGDPTTSYISPTPAAQATEREFQKLPKNVHICLLYTSPSPRD